MVKKLPVGLELTRLSSMDSYIDNKINDFVINLLQSVSIVLIVMLVFLGLRSKYYCKFNSYSCNYDFNAYGCY